MSNKNIVQIVSTFPPYKGGMGNVAYEFAKILSDKKYNLITFTPIKKIRSSQKSEMKFDRIFCCRIKPLLKYGNAAFLPQLFWKLKKFDIIHLHYPFFGTAEVVWLFKIIFGKNKKLIIHYYMDTPSLPWFIKIFSWPSKLIRNSLLKYADKIICASLDYIKYSDIADFYKKYSYKFCEIPFGVYKIKKNSILHSRASDLCNRNCFNGADSVEDRQILKIPSSVTELLWRTSKNTNKKSKILLFVGGLDKAHVFKGVDILLKAVHKLSIADYKLLIVGDGDLKSKYEKIAQKLNITNKVVFLGELSDEDLIKIYQQADLLVLPSINKSEAFGLVLIEAMAYGTSVIASNLPGVRTVFQNNIQGFLVEPGNVEDLKHKIEKILLDDNLMMKMKMAGIKLVKEKYDWEKISEKLIKIIQDL